LTPPPGRRALEKILIMVGGFVFSRDLRILDKSETDPAESTTPPQAAGNQIYHPTAVTRRGCAKSPV